MKLSITPAVRNGALALVAILLLSGAPFVVDATQCAVRTRFGRPVEVIQQPGLHFKLPLVDEVTRLDARLLYFDPPTAEFLTEDKKNVVISSFVVWRVEDPLRFIQKLYTRENAEARVADLVASELGTALGRVPFSRLVSAAENEAHLAETAAGIAEKVRQRAGEDYGLRVVDVGIRRLAFPEQNREAVFNRMRAERERIARRFRSEGEEEAIKIRAEAEQERSKLLAEAYRTAAELKGKGEAEAARIYAGAVGRDPELYRFLRTLESYDKVLDEKTTLILPGDSQLLRLLTEGPSGSRSGGGQSK
ncbi:MAG TPA: protease modulator HflC [Vicinamibacteria bacterium]|nr:protease modulator HflC [Vicinamibacteria bacterium]